MISVSALRGDRQGERGWTVVLQAYRTIGIMLAQGLWGIGLSLVP
jgi:hypothetical protein